MILKRYYQQKLVSILILLFFINIKNIKASDETKVIYNGPRDLKKVALTFDACPTSKYPSLDHKIVEILKKYKIPTTIFLSGKWVKNNLKEIDLLKQWPLFEFGNHSFNHYHMKKLTASQIENEIKLTQDEITNNLGKRPILFRPPYGEVNNNLTQIIHKLRLTLVQFDLPSGDPNKNFSPNKIKKHVLKKVQNGSIIVFHINKNGFSTSKILESIIIELKGRGYELTSVSNLLDTKQVISKK